VSQERGSDIQAELTTTQVDCSLKGRSYWHWGAECRSAHRRRELWHPSGRTFIDL